MAATQKARIFSLAGVMIPYISSGKNSMKVMKHMMKAIMNNGMWRNGYCSNKAMK